MTYHPLAETHDTGTAYFESIGLLGGSTGMAPLLVGNTTFPTPDGSGPDLTTTIVDSGLKFTFGTAGNSDRVYQFNLASTMEKVLIVGYFHGGDLNTGGLLAGTDTHSGTISSMVVDCYHGGTSSYNTQEWMNIRKIVGPSTYTQLATDATIYVETDDPFSQVFGIALYCDSASGSESQKLFMKAGATSQWIQVISTTDSEAACNTGFNAVGAHLSYFNSDTGFQICPFYVWGAA